MLKPLELKFAGELNLCNFCKRYWETEKLKTIEVDGVKYTICPECREWIKKTYHAIEEG